MDLTIPRTNLSEMVLYIWKIIKLPSISLDDLLYKLSFELFVFDTKGASNFIKKAIANKILIKTPENALKPSQDLIKKLEQWQIERKKEISEREMSTQKLKKISNDEENTKQFNTIYKIFVDSATLGRTASILQSDIIFPEINEKFIFKAKVKGSKEQPYIIEINTQKKILRHDCHDYIARKSKDKKFCKHLAKMFLILKDNNEKQAMQLLNDIASHINEWDFSD